MTIKNSIHPRILQFIKGKGWEGLRDIQIVAFDPIYSGENCILEAPTSGGKTEAVLFPVFSRIADMSLPGIKVIYIAPLKALLNDIEIRLSDYANQCGLTAFKWHGDVSQTEKIKQMIFPSDVLLTTPESLEAILLRKSNWPDVFANLEVVIVDEAHYFAISDRGAQLVSLLERLDHGIGKLPQRVAMTATIGNPDDLMTWINGNKRTSGERIIVKAKKHKEKDFQIMFFEEIDEVPTERLNDTLYRLLFNKKSIVFRNSRSKTEDSAKYINERNSIQKTGLPIQVRTHHSSVSKHLRETAESLIKMKTDVGLNAIISTSTLELGIDIGELDQIVQIGESTSAGSFLQRVGRTGRREGKPQYFRGLCQDVEELALLTACVNLGMRSVSECISFPHKTYHILAHQTICLCLQKNGISAKEIWNILSNADCFSGITPEKFQELIAFMVSQEYLRELEDGKLFTSDLTESMFLKSNWQKLFAVFDTGPMYNVVDGKKIIGTLDCDFVRSQKEMPFYFILGGIEWKAFKVNHEMQQVSVEKFKVGNIPKWSVFGHLEIPYEVAQEVGAILMGNTVFDFLQPSARNGIERLRNKYQNLCWRQGTCIVHTSDHKIYYLWTFAGSKINRSLELFAKECGIRKTHSDYQHLELKFSDTSSTNINPFIESLNNKKSLKLEDVLKSLSRPSKIPRFSKFGKCLPEELSYEALLEKAYDIKGALQLLKNLQFEFISD